MKTVKDFDGGGAQEETKNTEKDRGVIGRTRNRNECARQKAVKIPDASAKGSGSHQQEDRKRKRREKQNPKGKKREVLRFLDSQVSLVEKGA